MNLQSPPALSVHFWTAVLSYLLVLSFLPAQITGTNSTTALIYQDVIPSGIGQVLSYDQNNQGSTAPGSPPIATYNLTTSTGSINPLLNSPPGEIMRWQMWGQRKSPAQWFLLDVKAILPIEETLSVYSPDVINPGLTRVGKTYTVDISIAGMPTVNTGATETGQIYLGLSALVDGITYGFRSLTNYSSLPNPPVTGTPALPPLGEYPTNAWFLVNGNYDIANLSPAQPGQETWLIDWIETAESTSTLVDQEIMQVLPGPTVSVNQPIQPVYTGDTSSLPGLSFGFLNLFPGSLTVFQILDSQQNPLATLTVSDDRAKAAQTTTHGVNPYLVPLAQYITQPGTYSLRAWTAEPFPDGLGNLAGATTPLNYTWTPLPIPGTTTFTVQFTARVSGTIITN